ncbi:MAG: protein translocase subunit SecF, partial [Pseudomonadota bacterium]
MKLLSLPQDTKIPFMRWRKTAAILSAALCVLSLALFGVVKMNFGIDFEGGTVVELRFQGPADVGEIR